MRLLNLLALLGLSSFANAAHRRSPMHVGRAHDWLHNMRSDWQKEAMKDFLVMPREAGPRNVTRPAIKHHRRAGKTIVAQNSNTTRYAVNGNNMPDVHFDIGESYAGLMPISERKNEDRELFFWYFPSKNPAAKDEITIWLNGGPGCSSLEGLLQENGPFIWQYGTYEPYQNPWTWVQLTNVLWVEQPVGTGFTQGKPTEENEDQVAEAFLGFFKNFVDTFGLHNRKIYVTGESYAGYYVPYIASHMLDTGDKTYYDLTATMIYDPSTSYEVIQNQIPAYPFALANQNLFPLNASYLAKIEAADRECGWAAFREKYLTFPPPKFPKNPPKIKKGCNTFKKVILGALDINPCWDIYQVATTCPILWDVLGFPGSIPYIAKGFSPLYFAREDVQREINAPIDPKWAECSGGVLRHNTSPPSGVSVLPGVIERSKRTVIAHGSLDMVLIAEGTLLMIQNMTWHGKQGFQQAPSDPFYVPFHPFGKANTYAGSGTFGKTTTERTLTWVETYLSGHMEPQYAPSASFRHLEFLLGRVSSLSSHEPFTVNVTHGGIDPAHFLGY